MKRGQFDVKQDFDSSRKGKAGENTSGGMGKRPAKDGSDKDAKKDDQSRFWYDFGRYNLTGWSIVLPTLAGIALGYWLDENYPRTFSWTITLMVVGLVLGCLNAWYWISRTNRKQNGDGKKGRRPPGDPGGRGGPPPESPKIDKDR